MNRQPVPAPGTFTAAVRNLAAAQKDSRGAPPYSRFINRPVGRVLAAAAFRAGLLPNQVTAISGAFTFAGILLLAVADATWLTGVVVGLALMIGYALDSADGQLARLRGGGTAAGEWLDHVIDAAKLASIHLAVLITVARHFDLEKSALLLVPVVFAVVQMVQFFGMILTELIARERHAAAARPTAFVPPPRVGVKRSNLMTAARLPVDYGATCLMFVLLGGHDAFFVVYSLTAVAWTGYLLLALRHWYGLMKALDSRDDITKVP